MTKMRELETQANNLSRMNQELTNELHKAQGNGLMPQGNGLQQQPQIKSQTQFSANSAPNEMQRVQAIQSNISIHQGGTQHQPISQNHQIFATTQIPGLNFVQNFQ